MEIDIESQKAPDRIIEIIPETESIPRQKDKIRPFAIEVPGLRPFWHGAPRIVDHGEKSFIFQQFWVLERQLVDPEAVFIYIAGLVIGLRFGI